MGRRRLTIGRLTTVFSTALMVSSLVLANAKAASNTRYTLRIWQSDDGLPQNSVFAVVQSPDGYLWVGTHEGLARFDGIRFTSLPETAPVELRRGWITALCNDLDGNMWIACDGAGVFIGRDGNYKKLSEQDGLPSNQTRCLTVAGDGSVWIGSEAGLSQYKAGKLRHFTEKNGMADPSVRALCADKDGVIRAATRRGLFNVSPDGGFSTLHFGMGTVTNILKAVCQDNEGNIWVTSNEGATCESKEGRVTYAFAEGLPDKLATALFCDRAGQVWVGTYNGLACIADHRVVSKPMNEAGFGDLVYCIYEDREENLWVGARDGLYLVRPARFTTYTSQEGISYNNVMSVCEDRRGTVWLGTWGGGISKLVGDKFQNCGTTNGLTHDSVLSLHEDKEGNMWVGMDFDGGLNRLRDGNCQNTFARRGGWVNAPVRVIAESHDGRLWIGTSRGLSIMKGDKFANYTAGRSLPGNTVLALYEDREKRMWVGTDGGMGHWERDRCVPINVPRGAEHCAIGAFYEDRDGALWIGTRGCGLWRLKAGKVEAYTTREGLFNDEVYEIVEDDYDNFWMSCRSGIFRLGRRQFQDLDERKIKKLECDVFGKAAGLVSVQCNGVAKPSGWKSRDGRIWFPTIRGVVAVDCRIKNNEQPPPVVIEELIPERTDRRASEASGLTPRGPVRLGPGRGDLGIRYTALSFQAPEKVHFKYRLKGVDSDWVDAGSRREAFYNSVPHGEYDFQVIAANNDGVWNEQGAHLRLIFLPHFWQTWWFKLSIPAGGILLAALWYRQRVSRVQEIERLRVQIAADLHDDVGSRLTKAAMMTETMDRETAKNDRSKTTIQSLGQTMREIIQAMDEIVWTINPKNDTLENLANYIFQFAQDYFQGTGVRCRLDLPAKLPHKPLSTQQRHNLFMAVKEALNNVLKHSHATEARVGLAAGENELKIIIMDNGRGFDAGAALKNGGDGLRNMKQRLASIHGRFTIESTPESGTTIQFKAKI